MEEEAATTEEVPEGDFLSGLNWLFNPIGTALGETAGAVWQTGEQAGAEIQQAGTDVALAIQESIATVTTAAQATASEIIDSSESTAKVVGVLAPLSIGVTGLLLYTVLFDPGLPQRFIKGARKAW